MKRESNLVVAMAILVVFGAGGGVRAECNPIGAWNGTLDSTVYVDGSLDNWILHVDGTVEGSWTMDLGGGYSASSSNASGTWTCTSEVLAITCTGTATEDYDYTSSGYTLQFYNGTGNDNTASGQYTIDFTNVLWDDDSGDWNVTREPISDHVFGIGIDHGLDYADPSNADDTRYQFWVEIATDDTVELVEILAPGGETFTIPRLADQWDGVNQIWTHWEYDAWSDSYRWEYEATYTDIGDFDVYGDGTYVFNIYYFSDSEHQTSAWYGIPGTSDPIVQPTQEPVLTYPSHGAVDVVSPVTITWEEVTDPGAVGIFLFLETSGGPEQDYDFDVSETNSDPIVLANGLWYAEFGFGPWYETADNGDGIGVGVGKYAESDYEFTVMSVSVSGTVTDKATSLPVEGIMVGCWHEDADLWFQTYTEPNGFYLLTGLPRGEADINVRGDSYSNPGLYASTGTELYLSGDVDGLDFALPPAATLSGRVIDAQTAEAVANVQIGYWSDRYQVWQSNDTNSEGQFSLTNLPPGIGEIEVEPDVYTGYAHGLPWGDNWIYLDEGEHRSDHVIQLQKGALVSGYIKDSLGDPLSGIEYDWNGRMCEGWSHTDINGYYEIRLPQGTYVIGLDSDEEFCAFPQYVTITDVSQAVSVDDIIAYDDVTGSQISGNVSNSGGHSKTGEFVAIAFEAGTVIDPSTWYTISPLREIELEEAGPYALTALPPGVYDVYLVVTSETPDGIESVVLRDSIFNVSAPTSGIDLSYTSEGSTVSGMVIDSTGQPVLGASALLNDSTTGAFAAFAHTDHEGNYVIYNTPAGTYTVTAVHSQYYDASTTVQVIDGAAANVNTIVMSAISEDGTPPISDHVIYLEIEQGKTYFDATDPNDVEWEFDFDIVTDDTVEFVKLRTPAGYTFGIPMMDGNWDEPNQIWTQWYSPDPNKYEWELSKNSTEAGGLDVFGDGTYIITVYYTGGGQGQTELWYGIPDSNEPLPEPAEQPVFTNPTGRDGDVPLPLTLRWQECNDPNVSSLWVEVWKELEYDEIIAYEAELPVSSVSSTPFDVNDGFWEGEIYFDQWYDITNSDGIPGWIDKYTASEIKFAVGRDWTVYEVWGGDVDHVGDEYWWEYYHNIDQQPDYVKLGESVSGETESFGGSYNYYVIAAHDALLVDSVQGSTGAYCACIHADGGTSDWFNAAGSPDGAYATVGSEDYGMFRGFMVIANPGDWESVTVITDKGRRPADFNGSGAVEIGDFAVFGSYWMDACLEPDWCGSCDFNKNGIVDNRDFGIFSGCWLVSSVGPVPDVVGMTEGGAGTSLNDARLSKGEVTTDYSDTVPVDMVISCDPIAGTSVPYGSSVGLVVSLGVNQTKVGHWRMDDNEPDTVVLDSSGNGNNGTAQQNTSVLHATGLVDGALIFDGVGDYIQIADSDALSPTEEITVCGWFYFDDASENVGLIWKHSYNYALSTVSDTVRFSVWNPSSQESRASFSTSLLGSGWNFIAGVFDGTNSRLYLNEAPIGNIGASITGGIRDRDGDLYIGQRSDGVGEQYFDGEIDDVQIFNTTLSETQIQAMYSEVTKNLAGHWAMDDSADNTMVLDSGSYSNNGTAQQNTSVISTAGVIDGALTFDGVGDYVQIADSDALSPTEEITVCGWFYFDDASENVGLIWKHSYNYALSTVSDIVRFSVWNPSSQESRASFSTSLLESGWNFIAGVFDGTNSRLYLDGAPIGSIGTSITGGIRDRAGDLYIGQRADGVGDQYFDGLIDEVKIYGKALSASEVEDLYDEGIRGIFRWQKLTNRSCRNAVVMP